MFMTLAKIWQQIEKERTQLQAREYLLQALLGMKEAFVPTLDEKEVAEAYTSYVYDTGTMFQKSKITRYRC